MIWSRESRIEVVVPDFSGVCEQLLSQLAAAGDIDGQSDAINGVYSGLWGYVETEEGLFAFDSNGVGPRAAISETNKLEVDFTEKGYVRGGGRSWSAEFAPTDLRALPVKERVALGDFIQGGRGPHANYVDWAEFLETIAVRWTA